MDTLNQPLLLALALAPLVGSIIAGLFGSRIGRQWVSSCPPY